MPSSDVFGRAGVPEKDRALVTGGLREETGCATQRSTTTAPGSATARNRRALGQRVHHHDLHRPPGYEILHEGRWLPVRERAGHFTVNFGDAFRVLTRKLPRPVTAVYHRVPNCAPTPTIRTAPHSRSTWARGTTWTSISTTHKGSSGSSRASANSRW